MPSCSRAQAFEGGVVGEVAGAEGEDGGGTGEGGVLRDRQGAGVAGKVGGLGFESGESVGKVGRFPLGAPPSTQPTSMSISGCVRLGSPAKSPMPLTAPQGGIRRASTSSRMALAHGRASA